MKVEKTLYVHVGYPKTATTFLQMHVFPRLSGICYLGRYLELRKNEYVDKEDMLGQLVSKLLFLGINVLEKEKRSFERDLLRIVENTSYKFFLYSNECFLGFSIIPQSKFNSWLEDPFVIVFEPILLAIKLRIIFSVFEKVKILITLRRQDELILSLWAEALNSLSRYKEFRSLQSFVTYGLEDPFNPFLKNALLFDRVIRGYMKIFGESNVGVLVYEDLRHDKDRFSKRLASFLGIDLEEVLELILKSRAENVRSTSKGGKKPRDLTLYEFLLGVKRRLWGNRTNWGIAEKVKFLRKFRITRRKPIALADELREFIMEKFREDNRKLDERLNLGIKKYEYY